MIVPYRKRPVEAPDGGDINIYDIETGEISFILNEAYNPHSLSGNHIYSLFKDRNNRIWIGIFDKGISVYDPHTVKFKNTLFSEDIKNFFY